ncbi:MAG: HEAT repeat domain-containing protein [Gemmatimonadales bacterium]
MHSFILSLALVAMNQSQPIYAPQAALTVDRARLAELQAEVAGLTAARAPLARVSALAGLSQLAELRAEVAGLAAGTATTVPAIAERSEELRAELAGLSYGHASRTLAPLPEPRLDAPIADDPGDSLYRSGTAALNRGEFAKAAQLFHQVRAKYPASVRAADSYYWEAFALYRQGGKGPLTSARSLLAEQQTKAPSAATSGDASSLYARVQGELARQGDPDARIWVNTQTRSLAPVAALATPSPDRPERPESPERPERPEVAPRAPRTPMPAVIAGIDRGRAAGRGRSDDNDDDALPAGCDRASYESKIEALNALISMDDARAVPILRRVLAKRDACSAGLRKKAVFLLSQHEDDSTGAVLLDVVKNDPDTDVQAQAVFWLSQVKSPEAVTALESILKTSTNIELQRKALFSLSQQEDSRGADILRAYAERSDVPAELQEQAIFWLSQSDDPKNGEFLRGLYGRLTRESAKEKVLFALSQQDDPANGKWLIDRAKDQNETLELRKRALFWAGQRDVAISDLVGLYATMTDRDMREQLIFVYSQSSDKAAADKLFDIAKNEPDAELRKKALFWLGQSNDPRVAQLLQDIIDK